MGEFVALVLVVLLVGTAALQLTGRRRLSCWLLALFPGSLCVGCLLDIARGAAKIGESTYRSDQKQLLYCLCFLLLSVAAALRPQWKWMFWIAWAFNALVCGVLVYLAFFWKVFS
jgi:hypothetical protein